MKAAALQMTSGADKAQNLTTAVSLIERAAERGAKLVALPETFSFMGADADRLAAAEPMDGPTIERLREVAAARGLYLVAGSILEKSADPARVHNTSALIGPDGRMLATYRKMHLFDVDIPDGARYRESEVVLPGDAPVVAETELGRIGLSICYDLRFPELYRALVDRGAEILLVPSAFTLYTGRDHWEPLLRARAIENQAYVIAPAQGGRHSERRVTWGHAMIVDPWGRVLAEAGGDGEDLAIAEIDRAALDRVRRELPALRHRRLGRTTP